MGIERVCQWLCISNPLAHPLSLLVLGLSRLAFDYKIVGIFVCHLKDIIYEKEV